MINISDAFKQKLADGEPVCEVVDITFPDGTVKTVQNEIMSGNNSFSDCAESSSFPIGCVICKSMTLELDNTSDQWKNYNFYMAKVHAYLKMQTSVSSPAMTDELLDENYEPILDQSDSTILATKAATEDRIETIDKGVYTITTPEQYGEIISFTALDDMYKANATYTSNLTLPQSVETLVRDACETLGILFGETMQHSNLIVSELPENMTFRQLFGWAAMLETANARLDNRGYLQFIRWNLGATPSIELKDYINMPTVSSDDIVITGINIKNGDNSETYGTSGYILSMENNLVGESDLATVAAQIGDSIIGTKFRNLQGDMAFNPLLEFGDVAYTYDRNLNQYVTPLTDVSCTVNGKTTLKTQADDPIRGMSKFQSESTNAIVEARRLVKKEKTAREKAVEKLEETLKNSSGLYETSVAQEDGSTITYLHDKPTLAESKNVIKFTSEAIGVSNDGGKTYPYGFFLTGDLITKILYAHGINADYIDTGALIVRDSDGNIIFQVDMDAKKVIISGDNVVIGDSSLPDKLTKMDNNIASAKNMTFQLSNDMQTITSDADGNIPVFPTVTTTAKVMYGSSDITNDCSYTVTKSDSVTGSWNADTHTYTVTGLSADNGWVDIKATYLIDLSVTKRFTMSKQKSGKNGKQLYTWRKYASMPDGSDMSDSPDYVKLLDSTGSPILDSAGNEIYTVTEAIYVGIADNKTTETPSDNPKDYIWSRFRGEDGADGIGIPGENGETSYIHTAYANSIDGTVDFSTTDTDRIYIGHYSDFEKTDSADPAKYTWARMRGEDGPPGRTYILEPSCNVLKRGSDKTISPNFITFKAYYRDGDSATRVPYKGRFVVEETVDGNTWNTIYTSSTDEDTVTHYLYSILTNGSGQTVASSNGSTVGIPRDVTNVRCKLYASGGTTTLMDMQSVAVVIDVDNLTQSQIVEILSNDGAWKGLYYKNGQLYISFSAALGGELTLGGKNNGNGVLQMYAANGNIMSEQSNGGQILYDEEGLVSGIIQYDKIFFLDTSVSLTTTEQEIAGTVFSVNGISRYYGTIKKSGTNLIFSSTIVTFEDDDGTVVDPPLWFDRTHKESLHGQFESISVKDASIEDGFFTKAPSVSQWEYTSASNAVCWGGEFQEYRLMLKSSSSKRYKDIGNNITESEIEGWYNIEPTWAKYKDGYLVKGDENEGRYIPMFIAEDIEEYFPEATRHQNGLVEDWNERIMIPAMFAMIKRQKSEIDLLKQELNEIKQLLRKE